MKKKKVAAAILIALCVVLLVCLALYFCNFLIAARRAGIAPGSVSSVSEYKQKSGDKFRVFQAQTSDGAPVLAYARRDCMGLWHMENVNVAKDGDLYTTIGWIEDVKVRRFDHTQNPVMEQEFHIAFYGKDAVQYIVVSENGKPQKCSVSIEQAGEIYLIHLTAVVSGDIEMEQLNTYANKLRAELEQGGYVK